MKTKRLIIAAYVIISVIVAFNPSIAKADIHVYENNNQYLGILLELWAGGLDLFIPSLGASWTFEYEQNYPCQIVHFDSPDCSGTPYYEYGPLPVIVDISNSAIGGFHITGYSGRRTFSPASSYGSNCQCQVGPQPSQEYYPLTQVEMPFTTPIALPLRFEVETKSEIMPFPIVVAPKNQ